MAVLGSWITHQITRSTLATTGQTAAVFLESFVQPNVQDFTPQSGLSDNSRDRLNKLLGELSERSKIMSVKIWAQDGTLIYTTTDKSLESRRFDVPEISAAFRGGIVSSFNRVKSAESAFEQALEIPLVEVYAPLYRADTDEVIAVGEIYENSEALARQLRISQKWTWFVVWMTTLAMLSVLYLIVLHGSQTIDQQRNELQRRVKDVQRIAAQNDILRQRAELNRLGASEANEELLGRIGQELHDGPIQVLSLVMLRLSRMFRSSDGPEALLKDKTDPILKLTGSVIEELRTLSSGLVLPEIGNLSASATVALAVERHESLTGSTVELDLQDITGPVPEALKICLYRITQESLSNSFRHAGGMGQFVKLRSVGDHVTIVVFDKGSGIKQVPNRNGSGLGLPGIRNRVEGFGGQVTIQSDRLGTSVRASIPLH